MSNTILIYANCRNSFAKGDFAFAANMAKDLARELNKQGAHNIDVVLVSTLDGIPRFKSLYGEPIGGRIAIEGTVVGLSSLEEFDAVEHTILAFIDANHCKSPPVDVIKRILSPESKFMVIRNVNQRNFAGLFTQANYRRAIKNEQSGLYDAFHDQDIFIGSAGFGQGRLGIPVITKVDDLPCLSSSEQRQLPLGNYGFMYLARLNVSKDYKLIAQYLRLTHQDNYILVGKFATKKSEIEYAYEQSACKTAFKAFPSIAYFSTVPNRIMRSMVANSTEVLVASTGVTSTLEAIQDKKLTFYQDSSINEAFVAAYLIAVKSISSSDNSLSGLASRVIELSSLLFAEKPLSQKDMQRTNTLLKRKRISSALVRVNQTFIEQASGKIAPRLLRFLGSPRSTQDEKQLAVVCLSLRKKKEKVSPVYEEALRRAAAWNRLFELKVLIKSMQKSDLDKRDPNYGGTPLHWAVPRKNFDCVRFLIKAGASLNIQDNEGQTPLHNAVRARDKAMVKLLIGAGASLNIPDKINMKPIDYAQGNDFLLFINDCYARSKPKDNETINGFCRII